MMNFDNTKNAFAFRSNFELKKANILFGFMASPVITRLGSWVTPKFLWLPFVRKIIKKTIYEQFCGGENLEEASKTAETLNRFGVSSLLDYGAEAKDSEDEFDSAKEAFIRTVEFAKQKEYIPFISIKLTAITSFSLLEKMQSKAALNPSEKTELERFLARLEAICKAGADNHTGILIDAEESWIQDPVDELAIRMMKLFNKEKAIIYNTYQLYRHDRLAFLKENIEHAKANQYILGAKIVRGAYMEKERQRAERLQYESPIQASKQNTDRDYNLALKLCLDNVASVATFIGTHNEASCKLATEIMQEKNIESTHPNLTFSQLYGMSDNISFNLVKEGYLVCKYLPYGPVRDVIPYLLRRANENTSVAGQTTRELELIKKELKRRATELS